MRTNPGPNSAPRPMMHAQNAVLQRLNTISRGTSRHRRAHCISRYQTIAGVPSVHSTLTTPFQSARP